MEFKKYKDILKPDQAWGLLRGMTGQEITLELIYTVLEKMHLNGSVPEEIQDQFNVTRNLIIYTWFCYSLEPTAVLKSYVLIEHALRLKYEDDETAFYVLVKRSIEEGLIIDKGFSHIRASLDPQEYSKKMPGIISKLRNSKAHGDNTLGEDPLMSLQISIDFINMLFK